MNKCIWPGCDRPDMAPGWMLCRGHYYRLPRQMREAIGKGTARRDDVNRAIMVAGARSIVPGLKRRMGVK